MQVAQLKHNSSQNTNLMFDNLVLLGCLRIFSNTTWYLQLLTFLAANSILHIHYLVLDELEKALKDKDKVENLHKQFEGM